MRETDGRAVILGEYILDTGATVRATAKVFKISKSTVHKDVTSTLKGVNKPLYYQVQKLLQKKQSYFQETHS